MKKTIVMMLALMLLPMASIAKGKKESKTFTVLQWNIWQEGTVVKDGYKAILNELERLRPDYVTFSEVRNYQDDFIARVCKDMAKRGVVYYGFRSDDTGLLSSTPITAHKTVFPLKDDHGSIYKLETKVCGHKLALSPAISTISTTRIMRCVVLTATLLRRWNRSPMSTRYCVETLSQCATRL